jgi:hypothetical protein
MTRLSWLSRFKDAENKGEKKNEIILYILFTKYRILDMQNNKNVTGRGKA